MNYWALVRISHLIYSFYAAQILSRTSQTSVQMFLPIHAIFRRCSRYRLICSQQFSMSCVNESASNRHIVQNRIFSALSLNRFQLIFELFHCHNSLNICTRLQSSLPVLYPLHVDVLVFSSSLYCHHALYRAVPESFFDTVSCFQECLTHSSMQCKFIFNHQLNAKLRSLGTVRVRLGHSGTP